MSRLRAFAAVCAAFIPATGQGQDAFVWANDATADSYSPSAIYAFNPAGDITIQRRGVGAYTVVFLGLGKQGQGLPGEGGNVQVTTYGSSDRCNVRSWAYSGENYTVNVNCYAATGSQAKDSQFSLLIKSAPFAVTTFSLDVSNQELQDLQIGLATLSARVDALEAP